MTLRFMKGYEPGQPAAGSALPRHKRVVDMSLDEMQDALLTDDLTGLGNARALRETERGEGVLVVDVAKFKGINDTYGHENADLVLQVVARHLARLAGRTRAFRPYGDEFVGDFDSVEAARAAGDALEQAVASEVIRVATPKGPREIKDIRLHTGVGVDEAEAGHDLNYRAGGADARQRVPAVSRRAGDGGQAPGMVRTALSQAAGAIAVKVVVGLAKTILASRA
jgi:diguanylate cyclase (GGDEF)-like protein